MITAIIVYLFVCVCLWLFNSSYDSSQDPDELN